MEAGLPAGVFNVVYGEGPVVGREFGRQGLGEFRETKAIQR